MYGIHYSRPCRARKGAVMNNAFSLEAALNHVSQPVLAGQGGSVIFANATASSLFRTELKGLPLSELFPPEALVSSSESYIFSCEVHDLSVTVNVLRSGDTSLYYISPHDSLKGASINNIALSHLRSCTSGLKLSADRCFASVEDGKLPEEEFISMLYHYYYRITRAITQLDNVDKIFHRQMVYSPRLTDLTNLVGELIDTVEVLFRPDSNVDLSFTCQIPNIYSNVDPELFELMLCCLISNSIKHRETKTRIRVELSLMGQRPVLSFEDPGAAVPSEKLRELFSLQNSELPVLPTDEIDMGLFIANSIVLLHGGVIMAESGNNTGMNIRVMLPENAPNTGSLHSPGVEYRCSGISNVLSHLADVLPTECYGPKYED